MNLALLAAICHCTVILMAPGAHPAGMSLAAYAQPWEAPQVIFIDSAILSNVNTRRSTAWYATWAVAHELGHLRKLTLNEDEANCYALAHLGETAILFGGSPSYVRWLWRGIPTSWRIWQLETC